MVQRQVRVARRVVLAGGLAVSAVGFAGLPAGAAVGRRAAAPSISSTSDWGARDASGEIEVLDSKPTKIIVHHTATPNSDDTSQSHAFELSRQIQDYHMDTNGWSDTGQNFTNSRGGHLMEGRHKSLAALQGGTQHVKGAHAGEQNSVSLGIENEGTYTEASVPGSLWESLVSLCSYMVSQYGIEPGAIYGHRDFMSTACPGDVLYARLPELRESVGAATGLAVVQPVTWPLVRPGAQGPVVSALQLLLGARGASVPVDGVFGVSTQRAASGVVAERAAGVPSCFGSRVVEPGLFGGVAWESVTPVLGAGARGEAVRAAQVLLTWRGRSVPVDGVFGDRMVAVVREVQASWGLAATGVVDRVVWQRLLG
ncbi:peptidoglycan recognition protein family protein [Saccharopolyspora flava]|uniref:Peptidoglycan-binding (PGRP) domain of peptidoglycan hydrolases-containing protein n=1 Tax=Saccharopolyspora flava TaxID=95161 RepID=A0A1I6SV25_9PSEU|nr:N-acetylmuramoyl-L-alanine amidase [Saccharopolyspora flava]SFS80763.1 Peptidoglycan-binding (PGRP) domain of peptidoglycan hydrolases-containing protein [Saccharopolyspora flava]